MVEDCKKEAHQNLSGLIKDVHARLRNELNQSGDFELTWSRHVSNKPLLSEYASAMHCLAVEHWEQDCLVRGSVTRVAWCVETCRLYFLNGGLQKCIEKDLRRYTFHLHAANDAGGPGRTAIGDEAVNKMLQCCGEMFLTEAELESHRLNFFSTISLADPQFPLPFQGRMRLIDVGSCYNPFNGYSDFLSIGLDLCPAADAVLCADFLSVVVSPPCTKRLSERELDEIVTSLRNTVSTAPSSDTVYLPAEAFHIVVFSLLLEYLPSAKARWLCCQKAHQLLAVGGLLLIVTPDSSHVQRRSQQMKDWRCAIEAIGFSRCSYSKLEHLHCMAFRKVRHTAQCDSDLLKLLHIPQDTYGVSYTSERTQAKSETAGSLLDIFNELPHVDGTD